MRWIRWGALTALGLVAWGWFGTTTFAWWVMILAAPLWLWVTILELIESRRARLKFKASVRKLDELFRLERELVATAFVLPDPIERGDDEFFCECCGVWRSFHSAVSSSASPCSGLICQDCAEVP